MPEVDRLGRKPGHRLRTWTGSRRLQRAEYQRSKQGSHKRNVISSDAGPAEVSLLESASQVETHERWVLELDSSHCSTCVNKLSLMSTVQKLELSWFLSFPVHCCSSLPQIWWIIHILPIKDFNGYSPEFSLTWQSKTLTETPMMVDVVQACILL